MQLTGPADAGVGINSFLAPFVSAERSKIILATQHLYPLTNGRSTIAGCSIPTGTGCSTTYLLAESTRAFEDCLAGKIQAVSNNLPWRMSETNACDNNGNVETSQSPASALWGVEYMFTLAKNQATGVNFHSGKVNDATQQEGLPIELTQSGQFIVHPLYYALLMFSSAGKGNIVPLDVISTSPSASQTAYAVLHYDGSLRLTVLNKDMQNPATVDIAPGPGYLAGLAMLLTPTADETNVTLGGAAVDANGRWSPAQLSTLATTTEGSVPTILSPGVFTTTVPPLSALEISFGSGTFTVTGSMPNGPASAVGQGLAIVSETSNIPVPILAGVTGTITDSQGKTWPLGLTSVTSKQIDFVVPGGVAPGMAVVQLGASSGTVPIVSVLE